MNLNLNAQELLSLYKAGIVLSEKNEYLSSALLKLELAVVASLEAVKSMENDKNFKKWISSEERRIAALEQDLKSLKNVTEKTGFDRYVESQADEVKEEISKINNNFSSSELKKKLRPVRIDKKRPVGRPKKK